LAGQGQLQQAVQVFNQMIRLQPDHTEAYCNRGVALTKLGQLEAALDSCNMAIQHQPNFAEAYYNRGVALTELGQLGEAVDSYNRAIQLKPDYAEAYSNRGVVLCNLGQLEEAMDSYNRAIELQPDCVAAYSNWLLNSQYKTDFNPDFYLSQARKFRLNCQPQTKTISSVYTCQRNPTKLKIGLVSSDFGDHPGGYFSLSTLRELSRKNLELIAYSNYDRTDQWASQFKSLFSQWHSIQKQTNQDVVAQIVKDGIHILIDLQGHTSQNRLPVFCISQRQFKPVGWVPVLRGLKKSTTLSVAPI
ncbi:MAG: tetratricopeptide repeat protein, partial [Candidatus Poribacteria bacterium]|nr:tetratricopeptide repeat protein [Candidatus Poribacteria bacterium]